MNRQTLSQRERRIMLILAALVLGYILQAAVLKPGIRQQRELREEIAAAEARLQRGIAVLSRAVRPEDLESFLVQFRQTGTDEQVMSSLSSELEQSRSGLDLRVADTKPQRVRREEGLKYFSVQLTLYGQLNQVLRFVHLLQSPPHNLTVDAIQIRAELAEGGGVRCQLTVSRRMLAE